MARKVFASFVLALTLVFGMAGSQPTYAQTDPVVASLNTVSFNSREEFVAFFSMDIDPREVTVCPGEFSCVRVLREKDMFGHIIPFHMDNPTDTVFDGWMDGVDFRAAFGRQSPPFPPEARGSGVPNTPDVFNGVWVQGITVRPFGRKVSSPAPAAAPAPVATSNVFDNEETVRSFFEIPGNVPIARCGGENNCFTAGRSDHSPFHLNNRTGHSQDGERLEGGSARTGIPSGFNGDITGATLRP